MRKLFPLNSEGEIFESNFCKNLVKKAAEVYPDIKFEILTNGVLCNKSMLEKLNISDKIYRISLTLNAMTENTYEKIVRRSLKEKTIYKIKKYSEFNEILNNINYIMSLKKNHLLKKFSLTFCLMPVNFRELPDFAKLLDKLKIPGEIICFQNWGEDIEMCRNFEKNDILNPKHINHKELISVLQQKELFSSYLQMNNTLRKMQK